MPIPRFRLRTLMIAVACVALAFGGLAGLQRMAQRMHRFLALAREHRQQELVNRLTLQGLVSHGAATADIEKRRVFAEYHRALDLKYARAATRPWLPVPADPPPPE